jgi:hypothetical protein
MYLTAAAHQHGSQIHDYDNKAPDVDKVRDSRYDDDDSSSGSDDDDNAGNSFSHFLKRIRQENDTHEMDSSESSQGESDHDAPSETDSDDESIGMPLERMYSRLKKIHSRPISPRSPYHNSMMARRKRPNWWH